jgi:hypothetical protein
MADYSNQKSDQIPVQNTGVNTPDETQNRGLDTKTPDGDNSPIAITLTTIDETLIKYLNERIRPLVTQDKRQIPVPIMYGNPERWKSVQKDGVLRDYKGKIQLPLIMIRRSGMKKNIKINSPVNKYLEREFETGWNKYNPYDRFAALNGIKPVKQRLTTITPDYFDLTYECVVWTEYMEQMNRIVEQISFEDDEFWGDRNRYKFRTRIDEYKMENTLPAEKDRLVKTLFTLNVAAYLLPERMLDRYGKVRQTSQQRFTTKKAIVFTEILDG